MHKLDGPYPGKPKIAFLPMTDLNPSDESCIYTTLHFISKEAIKNNCTPILTFDQLLYWKAMVILQNEPIGSPLKSFVLKLGGFHTHTSFIGSFGYLMSGSGLANLLETVYASTAVSHMMRGKALARAVRGHFLVDTALTALILSLVYGIPVPIFESYSVENGEKTIRNNDSTDDLHTRQIDIPETRYPKEVKDATDVLNLILKGEVSLSDINNSDALNVIRTNIEHFRQSRFKCRTAKLWFQYMEMICILRDFIKAEKTGNWNMHLESLKSMLP